MVDPIETCRDYRATIPLSSLKISKLCDFPSRFYESLNGKNRMCELCTFFPNPVTYRDRSFCCAGLTL